MGSPKNAGLPSDRGRPKDLRSAALFGGSCHPATCKTKACGWLACFDVDDAIAARRDGGANLDEQLAAELLSDLPRRRDARNGRGMARVSMDCRDHHHKLIR